SLPARTITSSPFLIRASVMSFRSEFRVPRSAFSGAPPSRNPELGTRNSQHLRCERDDLHVVSLAQFAGDGTEDTRAFGAVFVLKDNRGIVVETDVRTVRAAVLLGLADDHRFDHFALLDRTTGRGLFDGGDDHVADRGFELRATGNNPDAHQLAGAGIVGDPQPRLRHDHRRLPFPTGTSFVRAFARSRVL